MDAMVPDDGRDYVVEIGRSILELRERHDGVADDGGDAQEVFAAFQYNFDTCAPFRHTDP
ncbi:hypothetical protein PINS_up002581 [Pythium insidiosum]|nr:hypothetical protein PINS_up002581 [Pythium insidiosum]